jgi:hypothetical protein
MKKKAKKETNTFLVQVIISLFVFLAADFFTILYFQMKVPAEKKTVVAPYVAYRNRDFESMKNLPIGGEFEATLPVLNKLKFTMSNEPVFAGNNPVYSLNVCCPAGLAKEFYTSKMPWAFILYDFEPGLATAVIFEMDSKKKTGRFEIVILDSKANAEKLTAVAVRIYKELLKQYKPEYEWTGSVRQEIN